MNWNTHDRAVSDLVAFTLIIGIILLSVTTAYVVGIDELGDARDFEREQSAVRAMESGGDTFTEVTRGDAPRRSVEFDTESSSLTVEQSSIRIRADGGSWVPFQTNALSLSAGETTASFESGLVGQRVESVALDRREPSFVCGETTTLTVVELRGSGSYSGGSVVVDAARDRSASGLALSEDGVDRVVVEVSDSVNQDAWERTLEADGWNHVGAAGSGQYECSTETVHVRRVVVDLTFRS